MSRTRTRPIAGRCLLLVACCAVWLAAQGPIHAQQTQSSPTMREDAELADVFFLDPDRGWAVGDRGVIWTTDNGGRHWRLQASGVDCRLESICFVDDHRGWAAGGWTQPYTHGSTAVLLATEDGGATWKRLEAATLPALRRVQFKDARRGWAWGASSPLHPGGFFQSMDGGMSWSSLPTGISGHWTAADWNERGEPVVANRDGQVWHLTLDQPQLARTPPLVAQPVRSLRASSTGGSWLAGDRGLLLHSPDGGLNWTEVTTPLSAEAMRQCDWRMIATHGTHCWVAGSPGSIVLHSADSGRTWQMHSTGQPLPLHGLNFLDEHRGWAVGALGTILSTRDGGRTWQTQRRGGQRAAMLGLFTEPRNVPLELISLIAAEEGLLTAVEFANRRGVELPETDEMDLERRAHEAIVAAGASAAGTLSGYPLRQAGLPLPSSRAVESWQFLHEGQALQRWEEALVRRIRQWRPDVIITEPIQSVGEPTVEHLLNQAVLRAVERANDPLAFAAQVQQLELPAWQVKKVFSAAQGDASRRVGSILVTSRLAANLGRTLADHASPARGLIQDSFQLPATSHSFRVLVNRLSHVSDHRDLFTGINLPYGSDARRMRPPPASGNVGDVARLAQKQRNVQQLLARSAATTHGGAAWLGQIDELLRGLDQQNSGEILFQLAQQYAMEGRWPLAAEVHHLLVRRCPNHALAPSSWMWLIQFGASAEAAMLGDESRSLGVTNSATEAANTVRDPFVQSANFDSPFGPAIIADGRLTGVIPGPAERLAPESLTGAAPASQPSAADRDRLGRQVLEIGRQIQQQRPSLLADPRLRMPLAAVQRSQGLLQDAQATYQAVARGPADEGWATRAQVELWLQHRRGAAPGESVRCLPAAEKPKLDGELTDLVWQSAETLELRSTLFDDSQWPAVARLAYDDQFLYFAVECHKAVGVRYPRAEAVRQRDADLTPYDRVDLMLDLDRDGTTYFQLSVDHRGWTAESCWNRQDWNPQWFVASSDSEDRWTVELAIAREDLTALPPQKGDAWSLGVQRIIPGVGFQSWSQPAAVALRPEGFGVLLFE